MVHALCGTLDFSSYDQAFLVYLLMYGIHRVATLDSVLLYFPHFFEGISTMAEKSRAMQHKRERSITPERAKRILKALTEADIMDDELRQRIKALNKKLQQGQPWDTLKDEFYNLHSQSLKECGFLKVYGSIQPEMLALVQAVRNFEVAETYNQQIEHLTALEDHVEKLQEEIRESKQQVTELKAELNLRDAKIRGLETDLNSRNEKMRGFETDLNNRDEKIRLLENEVKALKKEKQELEGIIRELQKEIEDQNTTIAKLKGTIEELQKGLDMVDEKNEELRKDMKKMKEKERKICVKNESRIVVGNIVKKMVTKMYVHVHPTLHDRTNTSYTIKEIEGHMRKYLKPDPNNPTEPDHERQQRKAEAKKRWEDLKHKLEWDEDKREASKKAVKLRDDTAHPPEQNGINHGELKNCLTKLRADGDISKDDSYAILQMFNLCKIEFPDL